MNQLKRRGNQMTHAMAVSDITETTGETGMGSEGWMIGMYQSYDFDGCIPAERENKGNHSQVFRGDEIARGSCFQMVQEKKFFVLSLQLFCLFDIDFKKRRGVPTVAQRVMNHEDTDSILGLAQWAKGLALL